MKISQLPVSSNPSATDVFAIETGDGSSTSKINYNALATAIIEILGGDPVTIAHGGTGATNAGDARTNLGITPANIGAVSTSDIIDIQHGGTGANTALGALISLGAMSNSAILLGSTTTISAGTTTVSLTGLTANHRVVSWGFSGNYAENNPPADITVTTNADSYTITASNLAASGITMTPLFAKP